MSVANNPILSGFYPDPSICRVGDDYYLVNSSFIYFPGVPIFHSKDLAHWEQIGNIIDREEQFPVADENAEISRGIFAPTIRYHEGTYYMITTNVSYGGNFVMTAKDPAGPWSMPHYLENAPGIDPSLFFDDDGKCYYVGTRPNPEGVKHNGDWEIWVQELDVTTMKLVGESMAIWKGALKDAIWPEGPHLYKINGYYFLMHAEGGTGPEHSISVARSKELFAWFEGCPRNPVFTHRNLGKDYPIAYVGHADLVDDADGNWYAIMLASRFNQKHSSMGRETFLAKVIWEDGWPVFNPGVGILEDTVELPFKDVRFENEMGNCDHFHFYGSTLDDRIVGIKARSEKMYSLTEREGFLRLFGGSTPISHIGSPHYLGIRQKSYSFEVSCGVDFTPKTKTCSAGLVLFQNHANHLRMEIVSESGTRFLCVTSCEKEKDTLVSKTALNSEGLVEVRLRAKDQRADIWMKQKDISTCVAENVSLLAYTTEEAGGFVGCTVGMYSYDKEEKSAADFAWLCMNSL